MLATVRPRLLNAIARPVVARVTRLPSTCTLVATPTSMPKRSSDDVDAILSAPRPAQVRKMSSQSQPQSGSGPVPEPATTTTLELTASELRLKTLLLEAAKYIDRQQIVSEPVVLRWAGGWVRDKLLGIASHDIDTAINVMTGEDFARKVCQFCKQPGVAEKHAIDDSDIGNLHKIASNPEKSKHLETTTIRLCGFDVDFVNLRKETYSADSRNPRVEFGTALEDALRRDATVNALFFNLNTEKVEDFTTGLHDMKTKLIRTPLEPLQTFTDDPLRVLRLVRFASRLGFALDQAAEETMSDPQVLNALRHKISRERVGIELEKMMKGDHPQESLKLIDRLGLYHTIFTDPEHTDYPKPPLGNWSAAYDTLQELRQTRMDPGSIYDILVPSKEAAYFAWNLATMVPYEFLEQPKPTTAKGRASLLLGPRAAREGIKASNKLTELISASHINRLEIMELKTAVVSQRELTRDVFGMAIRRWEGKNGQWRLQVLFALLKEAMETLPGASDPAAAREEMLAGWRGFLDHLQENDLLEAPSMQPLVNGKQLATALGLGGGKWLGRALEVCLEWQFQNRDAQGPEGAIEEVIKRREELGIPHT